MTPLPLSEILALLLNLAVGVWFVRYYPRYLRKRIPPHATPRAFRILLPAVQVLGYVVIAGTLVYAGLRLTGH